jgi:hypothetical protein
MAVKRIAAETLIELAVTVLRDQLQPNLPPEERYAAAMAANALEIARREILSDGESALWDLLDAVYPEGEGTIEQLARDIRSGKINTRTFPALEDKLRALVIGELRIRNPRFLKSRGEIG